MSKDFDAWNKKKKLIHSEGENRLYHERQVWWCHLGKNIGFEEDGSGEFSERPVLIVRGFSRQVCLVLPLTTSGKKNPYHFPVGIVGNRQSFAIISQIRLMDTKRFINDIGFIDKKLFEDIRKAVRDLI